MTQTDLRGSFPFFRMTVTPSLSSRATAAANRNPRDSIPAMTSGLFVIGPGGELIDRLIEGGGVLDERREVLENDAGFGEIRHVADRGLEVDGHASVLSAEYRPHLKTNRGQSQIRESLRFPAGDVFDFPPF